MYMLSAVVTLLRIQLHILARTLHQRQQKPQQEDIEKHLNSEMFRKLIEGTYKQLFGNGLRTFAVLVKQRVAADLADWTVKEKLHVEFAELVQSMNYVRRNLESDMESMIKTIFIPPEAIVGAPNASASSPSSSSISGGGSGSPSIIADVTAFTPSTPPVDVAGAVDASTTVQSMLDQTWDLLESPAFNAVYAEAIDACFRIVYDTMYQTIFAATSAGTTRSPSSSSTLDGKEEEGVGNGGDDDGLRGSASTAANSPSGSSLRTPPLASLLPQIKSIASNLLPSSTSPAASHARGHDAAAATAVVSAEVKEISSGPYLEAFCIAIFDAPLSPPSTGV
eukprot:CAMPEP_0174992066 /NCGR_PEP_ID=MMETSP0004_2-20121128/22293_1 /TAXON_ID=420556 /ORGANISM="Ochromonas sp., Strain CCMP1393" /LENGTH=336 /DNA_ID=CAMNT_0016245989 /DNA_START=365 /DNA_END=1375 /DNA_ORIENTATION=+